MIRVRDLIRSRLAPTPAHHLSRPWSHLAVLVIVIAISAGGCGGTPPLPFVDDLLSPPPVLGTELNAVYPANRGLLTNLAADGTPVTSGDGADPMIVETLRFYDTLKTPFPQELAVDYPDPFTGEDTPTRTTAPMTLESWKQTFGFGDQMPGEALQDYRDRVGIAVYYNRNELGLGRQLGCTHFVDGNDASGAPIQGVACFVTNHGAGFRQESAALQAAMDGTEIRNTVCITYRPTMDPGYQVQFYVYGPAGDRQEWARLDTLGPRPHPQVCMTCHGGGYDDTRHLANNANFLPLDPNLVIFAEGDDLPAGLTRPGQEERIRVFNAMAMETPLTQAQQGMVNGLYGPGAVTVSGSAATGDDTPAAWSGNAADHDFYRGVVRPYCATCHLAGQLGLGQTQLWPYTAFGAPAAFDAAPLAPYVCGMFSMPNAQPTSLGFWDSGNGTPVTVAGTSFPSAADALLSRRGLTRAECTGLAGVSGCNRGDDPDALCGGAVSGGALCDQTSGRCLPVVTTEP